MDFLELAKARYSVRSFKPSQITDGELERILEAGRVSPSVCNRQPFKVYVVKSEEKLKALKTACNDNSSEIRSLVKELVPTYSPKSLV